MDNYDYTRYQIERKLRWHEKRKRRAAVRCVWVMVIVAVVLAVVVMRLM